MKPNLIGLEDFNISLEGSFDAPRLVNNSGRTVTSYFLQVYNDTGMRTGIAVHRMAGILPGTTDTFVRVEAPAEGRQSAPLQFHPDGTPVAVSKISLDSVVFADGEFAGPDTAQFYRFMVQHYDTTQEFAAKALADMTKVQMPEQTIASFRERLNSKGGSMVAVWAEDELTKELLEVQRDFGPEEARQVAYERSQTPKLWRRNEARFGHS